MASLIVTRKNESAGFTLIELSIVLVIIGLLVGGVLVGQDLIRAAYVRAQITQIEKFNTAVNTFYGKYQALPGDMNASVATTYGFAARGTLPGQGDGNGVIEGIRDGIPGNIIFGGEMEMFWVDLSSQVAGNLIEGSFSQNEILAPPASISLTQVGLYMPEAKFGQGNYIYVWSGGWPLYSNDPLLGPDGKNYFGLSAVIGYANGACCWAASNTSLTVQQAYNIDKKVDDGMPQSGNVMAMYDSYGGGGNGNWAAGGVSSTPAAGQSNHGDYDSGMYDLGPGIYPLEGPITNTGDIGDGMAAGPNSCYDGSQGVPEQYSTQINGGAGLNCALSFKMQGGD